MGTQRKALVHRRPGTENREALNKTQFMHKAKNQSLHVFGVIGHDYKSSLHFYQSSGEKGRLIQVDYKDFLEKIVISDWQPHLLFVEDNDSAHGTRGKSNNAIKRLKKAHGINWACNPVFSPDLNPIEHVWRSIKQRIKNRGLIWDHDELKAAIQAEWDLLTFAEINKIIDTMPHRCLELGERLGGSTSY